MNSYVDQLVDEQHEVIDAPPRFAVQEVSVDVRQRSPRLMDMWKTAYCVRPSLIWAMQPAVPRSAIWYETDSREEAELVMQTMLFCGAPTVSIHSYSSTRTSETVETWKAVR
jgi:hypothetical protein